MLVFENLTINTQQIIITDKQYQISDLQMQDNTIHQLAVMNEVTNNVTVTVKPVH